MGSQHVASFFLINLSNVAELMVTGSSFQEFTTEIVYSGLAKLELQKSFTIIRVRV